MLYQFSEKENFYVFAFKNLEPVSSIQNLSGVSVENSAD